ncbi:putative thionin-like protein [Helianthus annuus]|nr:putative thionin-like protein [Helianthus annuus]
MAKNGCKFNNNTFMGVLVVFMLLVQGGSAGLYTCWGGCLNECFLLSSKQIGQRFPCYVNCLARCFYAPPGSGAPPGSDTTPPSTQSPAPASSPSDSSLEADSEAYADSVVDTSSEIHESHTNKRNYCIMECSLQTCALHNLGENEFKSCLVGCIRKCKDLNI